MSYNYNSISYIFHLLQNLTMHRLSAAKACFLSESTEDMPKPDDLIKLLDQVVRMIEICYHLIMYIMKFQLCLEYNLKNTF